MRASLERSRGEIELFGQATARTLKRLDPAAARLVRELFAATAEDVASAVRVCKEDISGSAVRDRLRLERMAASAAWNVDAAVEVADAFFAAARASRTSIQLTAALRMPRRGRPLQDAIAPFGPRALEMRVRGDAAIYGDPRSVPAVVLLAASLLQEPSGGSTFAVEIDVDGPDGRALVRSEEGSVAAGAQKLLLPNVGLPRHVAEAKRPGLDKILGALAQLIGATARVRGGEIELRFPSEII